MAPKVFVINDLNHDFEKAKRFGELKFATQGKVPIFKTDIAKGILSEGLEGFDIDNDFLLLSGPTILCIMATLLVLDGDKPVKTLVFDAKAQDYVVRHISM